MLLPHSVSFQTPIRHLEHYDLTCLATHTSFYEQKTHRTLYAEHIFRLAEPVLPLALTRMLV